MKPRRLPAWAKRREAARQAQEDAQEADRLALLLGLDPDIEPVMVRVQVGWYNPGRLSDPFCLDCRPGPAARPMFDCSAFAGRPCATCGKPAIAKSAD